MIGYFCYNHTMPLPYIDPVILSIGPFHLRWYGLMYIIGIALGFSFITPFLKEQLKMSKDDCLNFLSFIIVGIVLGGRLGYVFIYNAPYYIQHPLEIMAIWNGGMSYHGGALGSLIGVVLFSKKYQFNYWRLLDYLGIGSTFGLFFGRIGNFLNAELYGRTTTMPWGVIFPQLPGEVRHPSQLYVAFGEGILLFCILYFLLKRFQWIPGRLFMCYVGGYGAIRLVLENFRQPDAHIGLIYGITMGQILCLGMILFGLVGWWLLNE